MDAKELWSYECNWSPTFKADGSSTAVPTPAQWPNALGAAFPQIVRDARFGTMTTRYLHGLRDCVGGTHHFFDRMSTYSGNYSTSLMNWGMMENEADNTATNYRFQAVAAK
jgi:hypothetical protein